MDGLNVDGFENNALENFTLPISLDATSTEHKS